MTEEYLDQLMELEEQEVDEFTDLYRELGLYMREDRETYTTPSRIYSSIRNDKDFYGIEELPEIKDIRKTLHIYSQIGAVSTVENRVNPMIDDSGFTDSEFQQIGEAVRYYQQIKNLEKSSDTEEQEHREPMDKPELR